MLIEQFVQLRGGNHRGAVPRVQRRSWWAGDVALPSAEQEQAVRSLREPARDSAYRPEPPDRWAPGFRGPLAHGRRLPASQATISWQAPPTLLAVKAA